MSETKEHILKIAFGLFLQKNFKEVTMKEIVEKTGLSKGAFYHYFESKEKLFFEVIDTFYFKSIMIDFQQLNRNSLFEFYNDYVEKMVLIINKMRSDYLYSDSFANMNFITIMFDAVHLFPELKTKLMKAMKEELEAWMEVVKSSRAKGEFASPMTDDQIAKVFIYSNDGIGLRLLLENKTENMREEMLTLWNNFYKEIKD
jgi:AcrR family transcriptional regulator